MIGVLPRYNTMKCHHVWYIMYYCIVYQCMYVCMFVWYCMVYHGTPQYTMH